MKRLLVVAVAVAVAVAFAVTVYAAETAAPAPGAKETVKATADTKTGAVAGTDVTKMKQGEVWKDTVQFQKFEANGDYIYVMKDNKVIRLKHKLSDNVKKDMLAKKTGDTIQITSTYPLTNQELAVITDAK